MYLLWCSRIRGSPERGDVAVSSGSLRELRRGFGAIITPLERWPVPMWHGTDRMELRVGLGDRVLLGDVRAEFEMLADRLPERGVLRQAGLV